MVLVRFFFAKSSFLMSRQISCTIASDWSAFALISRMWPFSSCVPTGRVSAGVAAARRAGARRRATRREGGAGRLGWALGACLDGLLRHKQVVLRLAPRGALRAHRVQDVCVHAPDLELELLDERLHAHQRRL